MMVGHSIMCDRPGFDCLHSAYYYKIHPSITNPESILPECIPSVEDIPVMGTDKPITEANSLYQRIS